jgi:predicted glycoside hydrolase/deacetylase ChbG (UPF0249 family)
MKSLIVNADDFGWTAGVNRGIAEAHRNGLVTSTSLLANGNAFADAIHLGRQMPAMGIGVHLNLSDGPPVAPQARIKSLLDQTQMLHGGPRSLLLRLATRQLLLDEVECEWETQIQKVLDTGLAPTHLDGHKHVHMLPGLFKLAVTLAKRHKIPCIRISHEASPLRAALSCGRSPKLALLLLQGAQARTLKLLAPQAREHAASAALLSADYFCGIAQTGTLTLEGICCLLQALPEGVTEVMCHPGYHDQELQNTSTRLQVSRQAEMQILTNSSLRNFVAQRGIRLINYRQLANQA